MTASKKSWLPGRRRAAARVARAQRLRDSAEAIAAEARAVYLAQCSVAEQLREEERRNHFSDLFAYGIPPNRKAVTE